jgi:hypothetical protein
LRLLASNDAFAASLVDAAAPPFCREYHGSMRSIVSLLIVALIALGAYRHFLKTASPVPGGNATQAISITGVQMDLMNIAQAQRMYFAQNGSYATLDQLVTSGTMNFNRDGRDGYSYSVETTASGFLVTARHSNAFPVTPGVEPPHYPALAVDESMQVRTLD